MLFLKKKKKKPGGGGQTGHENHVAVIEI